MKLKKLTVTLKEASEMTGIPVKSLRLMIERKKLRATKPGKLVLVYVDSLEQLLNRNDI